MSDWPAGCRWPHCTTAETLLEGRDVCTPDRPACEPETEEFWDEDEELTA